MTPERRRVIDEGLRGAVDPAILAAALVADRVLFRKSSGAGAVGVGLWDAVRKGERPGRIWVRWKRRRSSFTCFRLDVKNGFAR